LRVQTASEKQRLELIIAITRFTKDMLFDEKMRYPESGGVNKSAIHLDILKDMKTDGEIYADDEIFYKNGKFLI